MSDFAQIVYTTTSFVLEELTDEEAFAFNLFLLTGGKNPKGNAAWPKVEPLFTQKLSDDSIAMHPDTRHAAELYLRQRIDQVAQARSKGA